MIAQAAGAQGGSGGGKTAVQGNQGVVQKNLLQRQRSKGASSFASCPPFPPKS